MTEQEYEKKKLEIANQAVAEQAAIPEVPKERRKTTLHDGTEGIRAEISARAVRRIRELKLRYDREKEYGQG